MGAAQLDSGAIVLATAGVSAPAVGWTDKTEITDMANESDMDESFRSESAAVRPGVPECDAACEPIVVDVVSCGEYGELGHAVRVAMDKKEKTFQTARAPT